MFLVFHALIAPESHLILSIIATMDTPLRRIARWKRPRIYMDESGYRTSIHILRAPAAVFAALFPILFVAHFSLAVTHHQIICASIAAAALLTAVGYWLKFVASSAEMLYAAQTILFVAPFCEYSKWLMIATAGSNIIRKIFN